VHHTLKHEVNSTAQKEDTDRLNRAWDQHRPSSSSRTLLTASS